MSARGWESGSVPVRGTRVRHSPVTAGLMVTQAGLVRTSKAHWCPQGPDALYGFLGRENNVDLAVQVVSVLGACCPYGTCNTFSFRVFIPPGAGLWWDAVVSDLGSALCPQEPGGAGCSGKQELLVGQLPEAQHGQGLATRAAILFPGCVAKGALSLKVSFSYH